MPTCSATMASRSFRLPWQKCSDPDDGFAQSRKDSNLRLLFWAEAPHYGLGRLFLTLRVEDNGAGACSFGVWVVRLVRRWGLT